MICLAICFRVHNGPVHVFHFVDRVLLKTAPKILGYCHGICVIVTTIGMLCQASHYCGS